MLKKNFEMIFYFLSFLNLQEILSTITPRIIKLTLEDIPHQKIKMIKIFFSVYIYIFYLINSYLICDL